jgi:hypothetical protein
MLDAEQDPAEQELPESICQSRHVSFLSRTNADAAAEMCCASMEWHASLGMSTGI